METNYPKVEPRTGQILDSGSPSVASGMTSNARVKNIYWLTLIIVGILVILTWIAVFSLAPDYLLHASFYDVGQGDSLFFETMQGNQVLIDGGPDSSVLQKLGKDLPFYDRTIDLMVLTHPHADHVSGLIEVLKRYKVGHVLLTRVDYDTQTYKSFLELLEEKKIPTTVAIAGQRIILDDFTVVDILLPREDLSGKSAKDANETSIVLRLSFGTTNFLLTGDASKANEREMFDSAYLLEAEVLKVGHQGSKTSSDPEFVRSVSPGLAVISVGADNRYGHPHAVTLETFQNMNISVLRTDEAGDIRMFSDGVIVKLEK